MGGWNEGTREETRTHPCTIAAVPSCRSASTSAARAAGPARAWTVCAQLAPASHHDRHLHRQESDNRDVDAPRQARGQAPHGRASQDEHLDLRARSVGGRSSKAKIREGRANSRFAHGRGRFGVERGGGLRGPAGIAGSAKRRAGFAGCPCAESMRVRVCRVAGLLCPGISTGRFGVRSCVVRGSNGMRGICRREVSQQGAGVREGRAVGWVGRASGQMDRPLGWGVAAYLQGRSGWSSRVRRPVTVVGGLLEPVASPRYEVPWGGGGRRGARWIEGRGGGGQCRIWR